MNDNRPKNINDAPENYNGYNDYPEANEYDYFSKQIKNDTYFFDNSLTKQPSGDQGAGNGAGNAAANENGRDTAGNGETPYTTPAVFGNNVRPAAQDSGGAAGTPEGRYGPFMPGAQPAAQDSGGAAGTPEGRYGPFMPGAQPAAQDNGGAAGTPEGRYGPFMPDAQPAAQDSGGAADTPEGRYGPFMPGAQPAAQDNGGAAGTPEGQHGQYGQSAQPPLRDNGSARETNQLAVASGGETALREYYQPDFSRPPADGRARARDKSDEVVDLDLFTKDKKKKKKKTRRADNEFIGEFYKGKKQPKVKRPAVFPRKEAAVRKPGSNISLALLGAVAIASVLSLFSMKSYIHTDIQTQSMSWMNIYNNNIHNLTSEILSDAVYIKKEYVIPENALSGAEPDPEGFHVNIDNSISQAVDDALVYGLMQSPEMVYSDELELWNGQPAEYYLDETIFTVLWKETLYGCTVNFAEVYIADPSQIRRKLSQNQYGSPVHMLTSKLAKSTNAVTAMSGDFYGYRTMGCTVYQRKVYRCVVPRLDICFVDSHGDFILKHYGKNKVSEKEMQKFVDDNDIIFSLSFGPNLIVDGQPQKLDPEYSLGQPEGHYARAAIAQMGTLHYLLCTIDGGVDEEVGTDVEHLARILIEKKCLNAYTMDGGQTATIVFNKKIFNRVGYGSERNISDIVYFASALGNTASASSDSAR